MTTIDRSGNRESVGPWVRHDLEVARLEAVQARAAKAGIGCLLLGDGSNLRYLAGIGPLDTFRPTWLVIGSGGSTGLVVPRSEMSLVVPTTWIAKIREYVEWPEKVTDDWALAVASLIRESCTDRSVIGVEFGYLTMSALARLRAALPEATFVDADAILGDLRMRKDEFELQIMRMGGRIHLAQLEGAKSILAPGVREYEISLAGREAGARAAAEVLAPDDDFLMSPMLDKPQTLGTGPRSAMVHSRASTCSVKPGDVVQICFCGPAFFGYILGFDRPLVVGEPSEEARQILATARVAHDAAMEAVRPGVRANVVHGAAVRVLADAGLLEYRAHRTGRGVGLGGQERPEIRETDDTVLEPGMTFTVEMGIYVPNVAGARFGDTVAVTPDGYEVLTPASYDWQV
jgi:Xaa-Pro dipeptidase